jgi:hypothetical protein
MPHRARSKTMSSADPRLRALLKLAPVIPVYTPKM